MIIQSEQSFNLFKEILSKILTNSTKINETNKTFDILCDILKEL